MTLQEATYNYCLRIADTNHIHAQRLAEWCGHGPFLEEDLALTNISLDLLGESEALYQYAAKLEGRNRSEDDLAYRRDERHYYNALITELPKGDFGFTTVRLYLVSLFNYHLFTQLTGSKDETLAALAAKSLKEATYHVRHSASWMMRLGDGTEESHQRVQNAVNELWRYTDDLFDSNDAFSMLVQEGIVPDFTLVRKNWLIDLEQLFVKTTLTIPADQFMQKGSLKAIHTEHLGYILAEMQYLQRAYPDAKW